MRYLKCKFEIVLGVFAKRGIVQFPRSNLVSSTRINYPCVNFLCLSRIFHTVSCPEVIGIVSRSSTLIVLGIPHRRVEGTSGTVSNFPSRFDNLQRMAGGIPRGFRGLSVNDLPEWPQLGDLQASCDWRVAHGLAVLTWPFPCSTWGGILAIVGYQLVVHCTTNSLSLGFSRARTSDKPHVFFGAGAEFSRQNPKHEARWRDRFEFPANISILRFFNAK